MKVHLTPRYNSRGHLVNRGKVGLVMNYGSGSPPERLYVGHEPMDVTGCKDPALDHNLKSGKLMEAGKMPQAKLPEPKKGAKGK